MSDEFCESKLFESQERYPFRFFHFIFHGDRINFLQCIVAGVTFLRRLSDIMLVSGWFLLFGGYGYGKETSLS